jgi:hypothetical protein
MVRGLTTGRVTRIEYRFRSSRGKVRSEPRSIQRRRKRWPLQSSWCTRFPFRRNLAFRCSRRTRIVSGRMSMRYREVYCAASADRHFSYRIFIRRVQNIGLPTVPGSILIGDSRLAALRTQIGVINRIHNALASSHKIHLPERFCKTIQEGVRK